VDRVWGERVSEPSQLAAEDQVLQEGSVGEDQHGGAERQLAGDQHLSAMIFIFIL